MKYIDLKKSFSLIYQKNPAATILSLMVIYFVFIWYPVNIIMAHLQNEIIKKQHNLAWIEKTNAQIIHLKNLPIMSNDKSFLPIVNAALNQQPLGKFVKESRIIEHNKVQITCSDVGFDVLIQGLEQLAKSKNIYVTKISVNKTGPDNRVKAIIQFQ